MEDTKVSSKVLDYLCGSSDVYPKYREIRCQITVDLGSAKSFLKKQPQVTLLEVDNILEILCHVAQEKINLGKWIDCLKNQTNTVSPSHSISPLDFISDQGNCPELLLSKITHDAVEDVLYDYMFPIGSICTLVCPWLTSINIRIDIECGAKNMIVHQLACLGDLPNLVACQIEHYYPWYDNSSVFKHAYEHGIFEILRKRGAQLNIFTIEAMYVCLADIYRLCPNLEKLSITFKGDFHSTFQNVVPKISSLIYLKSFKLYYRHDDNQHILVNENEMCMSVGKFLQRTPNIEEIFTPGFDSERVLSLGMSEHGFTKLRYLYIDKFTNKESAFRLFRTDNDLESISFQDIENNILPAIRSEIRNENFDVEINPEFPELGGRRRHFVTFNVKLMCLDESDTSMDSTYESDDSENSDRSSDFFNENVFSFQDDIDQYY